TWGVKSEGTQTVTFTNSSGSPVTFGTPTISGAGFALAGATAADRTRADAGDTRIAPQCEQLTVAPGASCTVAVTFDSAHTAGVSIATLSLHESGDPTAAIFLVGTGRKPGPAIDSVRVLTRGHGKRRRVYLRY